MPMDPKRIGKTIADLRKTAGFTQKGLADRLFISDKAVSKWERGLSVPDVACLGKLSVLLDVDIETLLEGKSVLRNSNWKGFLITKAAVPEVSFATWIYDKPLVYYLLSYFLLVGIRELLIVCSEAEEAYLKEQIGAGENIGVTLTFTRPDPMNRMRAVMEANIAFFAQSNIMTVFEKNIIYGANITYMLQRAMLNHDQHTIITIPVVDEVDRRKLLFDETRNVTNDNALRTKYDYRYLPIVLSPGELLMQDVAEDATTETLVETLRGRGKLFAETANRGIVELSVENREDVLEASNLIALLQKRSGTSIGCLEEIAWRRATISTQQLLRAAKENEHTAYGAYLTKLSKTL